MKRYVFEAAIQRSTGWGAFVLFPHSVHAEFGTRSRVPVNALLGGLTCQGSLMPTAAGYHRLVVPRAIREQLGKAPGDLIRLEVWRDDEPRTVQMPHEFTAFLQQENLLHKFEELTLTRRKEYRNWISSARREETRLRRITRAVELLRSEKMSRNKTPRQSEH